VFAKCREAIVIVYLQYMIGSKYVLLDR